MTRQGLPTAIESDGYRLPVVIILYSHGLQLRTEMLGPEVTRQTFFAREVIEFLFAHFFKLCHCFFVFVRIM